MNVSRPPLLLSLTLTLGVVAATFLQCGNGHQPDPTPAQDPVRTGQPASADQPPADQVRILISGSMSGRLEPCGCASGQLGGLARRVQHIGEQRNYDLLLEGGDLVAGSTELDILKLFTATTILFGQHPYDALGIGADDLRLPRSEWSAFLAGAPVVASNLRCDEPDWPGRPFVDKQVRGRHVRIGSFTLELPEELRADDAPLKTLDADDAWRAALAGADASTLRILMVHGSDTAIRALIPGLSPAPDLVVGVDRNHIEPTSTAAMIGPVPLVFAGTRGRVLLDVRLTRRGELPHVVTELVPLPASKTLPGGGGDPNVKDALLAHRHQVKADDLLGRMARQLPTPNGDAYVGTSMCKVCHPSALAAYSQSKHSHAWKTLVDAENDPKRYGWPVTAYPDCVSCHVVGYREQTGFVSYDDTPDLADVGCERCHGPGSSHMAAGGMKALGLIAGVAPSILCIQCHDFEQSPDFVYGERWPKIQHGREPHQQKK